MTPPAKEIGHQVKFQRGIIGLFKRACWEIPEIMASSLIALVGMGMATVGVYSYIKNHGENSEYKAVYYIVRSGDPRACKLKNPAYTEYTCD